MLLALPLVSDVRALPQQWYGPVEIELPFRTAGNPYDIVENDVRVRFTDRTGKTIERLGFFSRGKWLVRLVTGSPGDYTGTVRLNGRPLSDVSIKTTVKNRLAMPFVRSSGRRFLLSNQKPFWPQGVNIGWSTPGAESVESMLTRLAKLGANWTRILACHWDDRNPYWPKKFAAPRSGEFSDDVLDRWDSVIKTAHANGVYLQFVLQHHGAFSTTVNPNWLDHPWNSKNGGFLSDPGDFFSNPEAKLRTKNFYRYVVARWADNPAIMAWELFDKVQFTDRISVKSDWAEVGAWHDEMGQFIRALDQYRHLVTTSSELSAPIWNHMDFVQGHGYPGSVPAMLSGTKLHARKPLFYGEIGLDPMPAQISEDRLIIRDGVWTALLAGHAGAGQFWYWERALNPANQSEIQRCAEYLKRLGDLTTWSELPVRLDSAIGAGSKNAPDRSWEERDQTSILLSDNADKSATGRLATCFRGRATKENILLHSSFNLRSSSTGVIPRANIKESKDGQDATVNLNAVTEFHEWFAMRPIEISATQVVKIPISSGETAFETGNSGRDWRHIGSTQSPAIAAFSSAKGCRIDKSLVVRVQSKMQKSSFQARKIMLGGVRDGAFRLTHIDLDTGKLQERDVRIRNGVTTWTPKASDELLIFKRK